MRSVFGTRRCSAPSEKPSCKPPPALAAGTAVFAQGDPGATCPSLIKGQVEIVQTHVDGSQSVLRFIGPCEMCGGAAMMNDPFPADAVAVIDRIVRSLAPMPKLIRDHPEIGINATGSAGGRLFELRRLMAI